MRAGRSFAALEPLMIKTSMNGVPYFNK